MGTHAASGALGFAIGVALCVAAFLMVEKPRDKGTAPSKFYLVADPTTTGSIMLQVVPEP